MTAGTDLDDQVLDQPRSVGALEKLIELEVGSRRVLLFGEELELPEGDDLIADLAAWLYLRLHTGNPAAFGVSAIRPDHEFQSEIDRRLPPTRLAVASVGVPARADGSNVLFDVDRVWVGVPAEEVAPGTSLVLRCARPNLSPGFFMFVHVMDLAPSEETTRSYVAHDQPLEALVDWVSCINALIAEGASFRTKILSRRSSFPRNDALVFYAADDAPEVARVISAEASERRFARRSKSALCRRLDGDAGGVTTAAEPFDQRRRPGMTSFGEHRYTVRRGHAGEVSCTAPQVRGLHRVRCCGP